MCEGEVALSAIFNPKLKTFPTTSIKEKQSGKNMLMFL